ncbi:MAG: M48 family metalloprotease, partial [Pirellulaceae bacterium]|nr:M48 family metalloprotease [Pirellulaceae bacterium]
MQLAILIAVIGALAQGDAPGQPVGDALRRTLLMLGGTLVAPLAATIGSWRLSRDLAGGEFERLRENFPKLQSLVIVLWLAIVLCTMYLVEWPRVVRGDWSLAAWPLVDELLVLLPVVVPLVLYWSALARFEWLARSAAARQLGLAPPPWRLAATLASRVRHELGLVLGPALAVIAAQETLRLVWPAAGDSQQAWWLYGPLLIAMLLFLPLMVRRLWRTEPLEPGPLRDRLFAIARAQRAGIREILVWNTDGQLANAAVVGLAGGLRYVFLTDALLARLTDDQIAAVMRHELGHVRGRHLPLRLLVLLLPAAAWLA